MLRMFAGLQPYISGGDLPEMNPVIIKDFVNLLSCENKFGELERSLVQLAITSIDIHQVNQFHFIQLRLRISSFMN